MAMCQSAIFYAIGKYVRLHLLREFLIVWEAGKWEIAMI